MLRKLEKYEIQEEIGHGGMATVYRARDSVLDREVALKVMHPHLRGAEEARKRFHREARSVARLRHPKVLEIYDFSGEGSEEAYIAAELLTGPTLKRWREDAQQVPVEVAACVVIEVCHALAAAHEAGIVHRDVKPENVLLHENRTLKLTDFGIADMMDAQSMTATGQILGSPGHMAPEQIEGRPTDPRTDLFSLGTVLYYLATGRLPFTGRNPHQVLKRIMDGEYADPLRVNPTLGGELRAIIVKALERDPEARYQTADALREALEAFVAKAGIDEPSALLARYLADPEGVAETLRRDVVESLIRQGKAASDAGEVPVALDCFNRVLALDDGNERVLRLIEKVGVDRRRRAVLLLGGALTAVGAVSGGLAWSFWPDDGTRAERAPGGDADAGASDPAGEAGAADAGAPDAGGADEAADAGPRDAGDSEPDAALTSDARPMPRRDAGRRPRPPVAARTRQVRFASGDQQNFEYSVDGSEWRAIAHHRTAELPVGRHQIRLRPGERAERNWRATTLSIQVPAGAGEHTVPIAMPLRPGAVSVTANVRARVDIAGRARGWADGEIIEVPMRRTEESLPIVATLEGYGLARVVERVEAGGGVVSVQLTLPEQP